MAPRVPLCMCGRNPEAILTNSYLSPADVGEAAAMRGDCRLNVDGMRKERRST